MKLKYFVIFVWIVVASHFSMVTAEDDTNPDILDTLNEITEEIGNMQNKDTQNSNATVGGQRAVVGDIEKLKKIAQILETVGQALLPAVVDGQINAQNMETNAVKPTVSSEPVKILPKGLKLLQHHSSQSMVDTPQVE